MESLYVIIPLYAVFFILVGSIGVGVWSIQKVIYSLVTKLTLLEKIITDGANSLTDEIRNTTNGVENTNEFLRTKGFTITFVSGLKDKMEEVLKASQKDKKEKYSEGPTATPASFTER